jgi:hypothetical protein
VLIPGDDTIDLQLFTTIDRLFEKWLLAQGEFRAQCAVTRYDFALVECLPSYYAGEYRFRVDIYPRGGDRRSHTESGKLIASSPPPANAISGHYLDVVADDPALAYRGMAWEEWEFIQATGTIQSKGEYNIGQSGLTMWGVRWSTAAYYANGFAPWPFKPGFDRPGVIIAIDRSLTIGTANHAEIPEGELATTGVLQASAVKQVWKLVATEVDSGYYVMETSLKGKRPSLEQSQGYTPSVQVVVVPG